MESGEIFPTTAGVAAYRAGVLTPDQSICLLQHLLSTGLLWHLDEELGMTAAVFSLIDLGLVEIVPDGDA